MKKILLLLLLVSQIAFTQNTNYNQLDTLLDLLYQNDKIMGSMTILKDGKTVFEKSVGYQYINDKEKKQSTSKTKYRIGSITKTFTAVMIFQLIDEGKLTLDTKLFEYFPEVANAKKIEIAHLLNHSSGLFNITADENFNEQEPTTQEKMLSMIAKHDVDFQPGERHEYSNTNFVLLGYILERIEKKSYKQVLEERITKPLGLKNTYYGSEIDITNNESLSYYYEDDNSLHEAKQAHLSNPGGAGGIVSNPSDLVVFMNALFSDKLMSKNSFKIMTTINDEYGSGILSAKKAGLTLFAHNGRIDFFQSMLVYMPELKTAIALNANALNYGMMPIMFNAINASIGEDIEIPSFKNIDLTSEELKKYIGTYECEELPFTLIFKTDGKILKGAPEGSDLKDLKPTEKDEFALEALGVILKFDLSAKSLLFSQSGESQKKCIKKE
ncbi:beta-lactamase family protein [Flavobacteriaceae bacterium S0825]|uniref:serine hydrolase domain-containing protein n=1 Tax=Gaetbulibacter sp. S0825 TaxID=2720084 RepID=UPI0014316792|nr:serine hydrolase domain-containing protein [Gaetbulibacter sp. S0825]MCK0109521.1 beta-lactamase family protein [Flavobacteriaceae bacterium S0825]NIX65156.1 beta-lactamase family protein [Gaetbulibacter sp. S0825]